MSEDAWYVARDGETLGPFTFTELRTALAEGRVHAVEPVCRDGDAAWVPAYQVDGLVVAETPPPRVPPVPAPPAALMPPLPLVLPPSPEIVSPRVASAPASSRWWARTLTTIRWVALIGAVVGLWLGTTWALHLFPFAPYDLGPPSVPQGSLVAATSPVAAPELSQSTSPLRGVVISRNFVRPRDIFVCTRTALHHCHMRVGLMVEDCVTQNPCMLGFLRKTMEIRALADAIDPAPSCNAQPSWIGQQCPGERHRAEVTSCRQRLGALNEFEASIEIDPRDEQLRVNDFVLRCDEGILEGTFR